MWYYGTWGVGREQELHRQILGFSYSHDHESVRIWGHYPVINEDKTTFWRYPIRKFDFTERKGLEKWVSNGYVLLLTTCLLNRILEKYADMFNPSILNYRLI
jgi:hypothetical protein